MGAGGIGGIVASTLMEVGSAVTAVSTNALIRAAVDKAGFRVVDDGEERTVRGWVSPAPEGKYDLAILATQPPNVEEAARTALPHLVDDAQVVVLQNGLCEERIAAIVGAERVIGGIVAWGASMPEPGRYERTAAGGFQLGRLSGEIDGDVRRIGELLEAVGPVTLSSVSREDFWVPFAMPHTVSTTRSFHGVAMPWVLPRVTISPFRKSIAGVRPRSIAASIDERIRR